MTLTSNKNVILDKPKITKEASTSMEDLSTHYHHQIINSPGSVIRPKSMCIPPPTDIFHTFDQLEYQSYKRINNSSQRIINSNNNALEAFNNNGLKASFHNTNNNNNQSNNVLEPSIDRMEPFINNKRMEPFNNRMESCNSEPSNGNINDNNIKDERYIMRRKKIRRNPVQRAASRLYRALPDVMINSDNDNNVNERQCVGPEFVVRATLPSKQIAIIDPKGHNNSSRINVTVIMLNGQKVIVNCNPNTTTANQLFEVS